MHAIIKLTKAQDSRIRTLENVIKKYSEGDLNEIYEINKQLNNTDRRNINKAVNELKKAEQEVLAAENEIGIWDNEEDLVFVEEDGLQTPFQTPFP